jgi:Zn-dependent peptidase ImmA (M78 family)
MNINPCIDQNRIEIEAYKVLEAYKITRPVVDVGTIAKGEGIKIKEINMPSEYEGVAGFYNKEDRSIYLNKDDSPQRKLFSIAHELGHVFLKHKRTSVLFRIPREDTQYPQEEQEANSFAAHLLMPDFMVKEYLNKYNLSQSDYKIMASMFGVPISSMKHTLEWLK